MPVQENFLVFFGTKTHRVVENCATEAGIYIRVRTYYCVYLPLMKFIPRIFFILLLAAALLPSCKTDFEVYAPEKEIRVVYCILNPADTVQYVRIAKAFQFKGDAIAFAGANDLSVKNLDVKLIGNGVTYHAIEMNDIPKDSGMFYPVHTLYKFVTDSSGPGKQKLAKGETYRLEIGTSDAGDYITGETSIPTSPKIKGSLSLQAGAGNTKCVPRLALDDAFILTFDQGTGKAFEVRVYFDYFENGQPRQSMWGPSFPFRESRGCISGAGQLCYSFSQGELVSFFKQYMPSGPVYSYDRSDSCVTVGVVSLDSLAKPIRFEVTAMDEYLGNYIEVNNPAFEDLSGTKPEYTNLTGNIEVIGIFGSISKDWKGAILQPCPEWQLGLNFTPKPPDCQ